MASVKYLADGQYFEVEPFFEVETAT